MSAIAENLLGFGVIFAVCYMIYRMIVIKHPKFKEYFESKTNSIINKPLEVKEQLYPQNRVTI